MVGLNRTQADKIAYYQLIPHTATDVVSKVIFRIFAEAANVVEVANLKVAVVVAARIDIIINIVTLSLRI